MDYLSNWNRFKKFDRAIIYFFIILNIAILFFYKNIPDWPFHIFKHLVIIALIFWILPVLDRQNNRISRFFRYWYLIIAFPFIYWNLGNFIHLVYPGEFDPYIIQWETAIFGTLPNIWIQKWVNPFLTEIMQISYAIYWFTIPVGAAIFYIKDRMDEFEFIVFYVSLTFFISYAFFILLPVAGPRFVLAEQITVSYKGYLLAPILRNFVAGAGLRGGAFPSSHVAVAIVVLFFVWKYFPAAGKRFFLPAVIALSIATVYGQYHYVTDVIAGALLGIIVGWVGIKHCEKMLHQKEIPVGVN